MNRSAFTNMNRLDDNKCSKFSERFHIKIYPH